MYSCGMELLYIVNFIYKCRFHYIINCKNVYLQSLPRNGINIFGSQLHTHLTGIAVVTRHIRNGRELPLLNRDSHYSQHFQEIRMLKRVVNVLPVRYYFKVIFQFFFIHYSLIEIFYLLLLSTHKYNSILCFCRGTRL